MPFSSVSGLTAPVLASNGSGAGSATTKFFVVTSEMKKLKFGLAGNKDITSSYASLTVDGKEMNRVGPESPKIVVPVSWDLSKYEGKTAKVTLKQDGGWMALGTPTVTAPKTSALYHLERRFTQSVNAVLSTSVTSPETTDGFLRAYVPVPPNLPTQSLKSCKIVYRNNPNLNFTKVRDINNPSQEYLCMDIPIDSNTLKQPCTIDMMYSLDLFEVNLKQGSSSSGQVVAVASPSIKDMSVFTKPSYLCDFDNPKFQSWMKSNNLIKEDSETNLNFGYRVFKFVAENFTGGPATDWPQRRASVLCQTMVGDCGSNTVLFASICQANNVPCIVQPGRWALNEVTTGDTGQFHVSCLLFDEATGLVPVDATFGVGAYKNRDNFSIWYGKNEGKFITFGTGATFSPEKGKDIYLGQFMIIHRIGGTTPFNPKWSDHWSVSN